MRTRKKKNGRNTSFSLLGASLLRILQQPWFYLCAAGITLVKFIGVFSDRQVFKDVFVDRNFLVNSIQYLMETYSWSAPGKLHFLYYITVCLAAFPVIANYIQDEKNNRMSSLLPRAGYGSYSFAQVFTAFFGGFLCMVLGDLLLMGIACGIIGLPFADFELSALNGMSRGDVYLHALFLEMQRGLNVSFLAVLSLTVSFIVRDTQFVTVLPMILQFFFLFVWTNLRNTGCPDWLQPYNIYVAHIFLENGEKWFRPTDLQQMIYVVVFTAAVGMLMRLLFERMLRRRMRG